MRSRMRREAGQISPSDLLFPPFIEVALGTAIPASLRPRMESLEALAVTCLEEFVDQETLEAEVQLCFEDSTRTIVERGFSAASQPLQFMELYVDCLESSLRTLCEEQPEPEPEPPGPRPRPRNGLAKPKTEKKAAALSTGAIVGIGAGVVLVAGGVWLAVRRRRAS